MLFFPNKKNSTLSNKLEVCFVKSSTPHISAKCVIKCASLEDGSSYFCWILTNKSECYVL